MNEGFVSKLASKERRKEFIYFSFCLFSDKIREFIIIKLKDELLVIKLRDKLNQNG